MIINHNIAALNTYRQLTSVSSATNRSLERLSSGLRINRAGDDAAGLAISEKMRGQIKGLQQASRNAQDAISMMQTAEGALNETHSILQRMRELVAQAASDTATVSDRDEIQKEINQLTSEINRIGNTTEFNTQKLLKGGDGVNLTSTSYVADDTFSGGAAESYTQNKYTVLLSGGISSGDTFTIGIGGQSVTITFNDSGTSSYDANTAYNVTSTTASVNLSGMDGTDSGTATEAATALKAALEAVFAENTALTDNFELDLSGKYVTLTTLDTGAYNGIAGAGIVSGISDTGITTSTGAVATAGDTTAAVAAKLNITTFSGVNTVAEFEALVSKGLTINGKTVEFYNANDGAYTGTNIGINLSDYIDGGENVNSGVAEALYNQLAGKVDGVTIGKSGTVVTLTANEAGTAGNSIEASDGGTQADFEATFQVGANKGQSFSVGISDMRASAMGIVGSAGDDGFTSTLTVTDGTSSTLKEAALDVSTQANASDALDVLDDAIQSVSSQRSQLGAFQNRLEHTINNLGTSAENMTAAESRIRDVDMAQEMMEFTKNSIITQAATAMLAQANQQPQLVLQLLR